MFTACAGARCAGDARFSTAAASRPALISPPCRLRVGRVSGRAKHLTRRKAATQPSMHGAGERAPIISSSFLKYSPVSAWWKATMPDGSSDRHSSVLFAVVANPSGTSAIEHTTTPAYAGVLSVMRPSPLFSTWLPYRNDISLDGFSHTCRRRAATRQRRSSAGARRAGAMCSELSRAACPQQES